MDKKKISLLLATLLASGSVFSLTLDPPNPTAANPAPDEGPDGVIEYYDYLLVHVDPLDGNKLTGDPLGGTITYGGSHDEYDDWYGSATVNGTPVEDAAGSPVIAQSADEDILKAITINGIYETSVGTDDPTQNMLYIPTGADTGITAEISSTSYAGWIDNPDNTFMDNNDSTDQNIGTFRDGLLNGAVATKKDDSTPENNDKANFYFDPLMFIDPEHELYDLGADGSDSINETTDFLDPGWVRLGGNDDIDNKTDADGNYLFEYDSVSGVNLQYDYTCDEIAENCGVFKNISFNANGTWELSIDENFGVENGNDLLGRDAKFDHLAFVIKIGNEADSGDQAGSWMVFDFDFDYLINNLFLGAPQFADFSWETAYTFTGTWANEGLLSKISHFSIWARDPVVPLPGAVWLFGTALLGLAGFRRFKRNTPLIA